MARGRVTVKAPVLELELGDPLGNLERLTRHRAQVDALEAALVRDARRAGCTWRAIAAAMSSSKSVVHRAHGEGDDAPRARGGGDE